MSHVKTVQSSVNNHGKMTDERISVCTDCRAGIFKKDKYLWTRRGLVHEECDAITNAA